LQKIDCFKNFQIKNDTWSWKNGADIAPETLYELLINALKQQDGITKIH
jgi:hypothetical protein